MSNGFVVNKTHTFVKSFRNTHRTHTEYDWSVYWLAFCLICRFDPINISKRSSCENFSLLAEAKCHAVGKMTTDQSYSVCVRGVFLKDFTKHVDSLFATKVKPLLNFRYIVSIIFNLYYAFILHYIFNFFFGLHFLKCMFGLLRNRA